MKNAMAMAACIALAAAPAVFGGEAVKTKPSKSAPKETPMPKPEFLLDPAKATDKAPDSFKVLFATTKGDFTVEVHRPWSPKGADRFYNLVESGFYSDVAFFRVIGGFMAQFGIHGSPEVSAKWRNANIADDPSAGQTNGRGTVSFATAGPNTRTTQMFINFSDNGRLDSSGFTPFGKVAGGMDVVDKLYKGYGEGAPGGNGPEQGRIQREGNAYLKKDFPMLDYIRSAKFVK
jgi:peptidyl-prolyl cis-trans isomerase A (cyclophilin A)